MIRQIARGHIVVEFEAKVAKVLGEALLPGHGSPDFVIYGDLLTAWESPDDAKPVSADERERLLKALVEEMTKSGMTVEVE